MAARNEQSDRSDVTIGKNAETMSRPAPLVIFPYEPLPPDMVTGVKEILSYSFVGTFKAEFLTQSATEFISSNADADIAALAKVIRKFLDFSEEDFNFESSVHNRGSTPISCWLCIRMWLPRDELTAPHWHRDGRGFPSIDKST
ncbi:hypothetical protein SCUP515_07708 [Seiridium cupressi]